MERYDEALADYSRAIELDPEEAWVIASHGAPYRAMGRYHQALADYDRAIELDPAEVNSPPHGLRSVNCRRSVILTMRRPATAGPRPPRQGTWLGQGTVLQTRHRYAVTCATLALHVRFGPDSA